jgi:hypothetical protein
VTKEECRRVDVEDAGRPRPCRRFVPYEAPGTFAGANVAGASVVGHARRLLGQTCLVPPLSSLLALDVSR